MIKNIMKKKIYEISSVYIKYDKIIKNRFGKSNINWTCDISNDDFIDLISNHVVAFEINGKINLYYKGHLTTIEEVIKNKWI